MTSFSANGSPPSSMIRAGGDAAKRSTGRPGDRYSSGPGFSGTPSTVAAPSSASTAYSQSGRSGSDPVSPVSVTSAPTSGLNVRAGETAPSSSPISTVARNPGPVTTGRSA